MAVVIGRLLALAFIVCFGTGLFSHFLQEPLAWMRFPTRPIGIYQLSQGIHITAGILCFPLILAKLYVVFPDLFQTPPVRSFAHLLERASIALFVAASLIEITIGLLNTYQWYPFPFPFRQTHYALSFVIIGSLAVHIAVKLDLITKYWRKKTSYSSDGTLVRHESPALAEAEIGRDSAAGVAPESRGLTGMLFRWIDGPAPVPAPSLSATVGSNRSAGSTGSVGSAGEQPAGSAGQQSAATDAATASRRGFIATVAVASAAIVAFTGGQSFRVLDQFNLFAPRKNGVGPNDLPVNRTATAAKVTDAAQSADWSLTVIGVGDRRSYSRAELLELPQYEVQLPISCVEGWSQMARWKGVRLRDLMDSVGAAESLRVRATSLEQGSIYAVMEMGPEYVRDEQTLVALELNGEVLDLDHGYPARMIAPARPGVLQTKWLSTIEVLA